MNNTIRKLCEHNYPEEYVRVTPKARYPFLVHICSNCKKLTLPEETYWKDRQLYQDVIDGIHEGTVKKEKDTNEYRSYSTGPV